jgi:hypothetical protein
MELKGKQLDLLERADECAGIFSRPKHASSRFTHLTPAERGIVLAVQEHIDAKIAELRAELMSFRHAVTTRGDAE